MPPLPGSQHGLPVMRIEYLSQFDVLQLRTRLEARQRERFEVMNLDRLQAALAAPRQAVFGHELHPTLWDKASALLTLLIRNHPFYDGNKRVACAALREFLRRNGYELAAAEQELAALATRIVLSEATPDEVARWLEQTSTPR